MFTPVNSYRKIIEHFPSNNVLKPTVKNNLTVGESKLISSKKLQKLLSNNDEYSKLQITIFLITFFAATLMALITGIFINASFGLSLFTGAIAGIFYLRLLAKSIGKIGKESSGVSKSQLLIPICLFIFASKIGSIEILPAMIGFFIYKPCLIFYFSLS